MDCGLVCAAVPTNPGVPAFNQVFYVAGGHLIPLLFDSISALFFGSARYARRLPGRNLHVKLPSRMLQLTLFGWLVALCWSAIRAISSSSFWSAPAALA